MKCEPLEPRRIRHPRGAYGWTDLKAVTEGHLERLGTSTALTYLFLCAVGNCHGMSFWSSTRMARVLGLTPEAIQSAIERLVGEDLIVARDHVVQVLPIPDRSKIVTGQVADQASATRTTPQLCDVPPDTIVGDAEILEHEPEARVQMARFLGQRAPKPSAVRRLAKALAMKAKRLATDSLRAQVNQEVTPRG